MYDQQTLKILFLYSRMSGHVIGLLQAIRRAAPAAEIEIVYWDKATDNGSRYQIDPRDSSAFVFHRRSEHDSSSLFKLINRLRPALIYVAGWMDGAYLAALRKYRSSGGDTKVICGIDDQWKGSVRQYVGQWVFRLSYRRLFDYMWVAGMPQYHYAQRYGYDSEHIVSNLLSANTAIFNRPAGLEKRFVFVGRFDPVKGLEVLLDAYSALPESVRLEWPLVLIGDGEQRDFLQSRPVAGLTIKPFMQPETLFTELQKGGVACVTSHHEQWGLVVHEMASLGYPLILSTACGAASEFLIPGFNGFLFRAGEMASLHGAMRKVTQLPQGTLRRLGENSQRLGSRINSEYAAFSFLSVLELAQM